LSAGVGLGASAGQGGSTLLLVEPTVVASSHYSRFVPSSDPDMAADFEQSQAHRNAATQLQRMLRACIYEVSVFGFVKSPLKLLLFDHMMTSIYPSALILL